jgi:hypothetical protein
MTVQIIARLITTPAVTSSMRMRAGTLCASWTYSKVVLTFAAELGLAEIAKGLGPLILIGQSRCWTNWPDGDLASLFLRYGRLNKNPTLKNGELLPREGFCDSRNPQYEN